MSWAGLAQGHESAPLKARPHIDVNKWLLELPIPADLEAQWLEKTEASRKCCTWLSTLSSNNGSGITKDTFDLLLAGFIDDDVFPMLPKGHTRYNAFLKSVLYPKSNSRNNLQEKVGKAIEHLDCGDTKSEKKEW